MSIDNPFHRLAPFIQEYIYANRWTELRDGQVMACRVLFDTDAHLLLATGTASGKTEAAFLPVLTLLHEQPANSIGALYIGPTKALINDQFFRLDGLLKQANIPVWHWHGDVPQSHKQKLLKRPFGVLQITPESLESLLINRPNDLTRLFSDLRFIVIDEIHVFMNADRGRQILCQLKRLERFMSQEPRRIGLSATLGDYAAPKTWLQGGSAREVICPELSSPRQIRLYLEHFYLQEQENEDIPPSNIPYIRFLYKESRAKQKSLIFANSRGETEKVIASLRQIAQQEGQPDIYHVHHGNIAAPLREAAENAMRDEYQVAVTAATTTLELGIDLGQLERVLQLQAPYSVASFLQRLGRSGRRGSPAEMWFACTEDEPTAETPLPEQIPWSLLRAIAIIQLYLEEQWIEPITAVRYPFSLLYHQTMSILASTGELSPAALAERTLTLPVFHHITQDDYRDLLHHLIEIDHIHVVEGGKLIVGLAGEKIVGNFRFYAVFPDDETFQVRDKAKEIGSIMTSPPPGERFALAGRTWEVLEIDAKRKVIFVKQVKGKANAAWGGGAGNIHTKVLQRMRQVLLEQNSYPYLGTGATARLQSARLLAQQIGLEQNHILSMGGGTAYIFPWLGTIATATLARYLAICCSETVQPQSVTGYLPYHIQLRLNNTDIPSLLQELKIIKQRGITEENLLTAEEVPQIQKYDQFVPPHLLRKAFAADQLLIDELADAVMDW